MPLDDDDSSSDEKAEKKTKKNHVTFIDMEIEKPLIRQNAISTMPIKQVEVQIVFLQIGEVDTINEKFQANVKITAKWCEHGVILDDYDSKKNWNPEIYISNVLHLEKFKEEITYELLKYADKTIIIETRVAKGSFWEKMELNDFPFDIQELSINLQTKHEPFVCSLISDKYFKSQITTDCIASFRDQQKFKLYRLIKVNEISRIELSRRKSTISCEKLIINLEKSNNKVIVNEKSQKSNYVATCFCSRIPGYYIKNVYSFNFLITVLSLTLFVIDTKLAQNRISGTFTLILTSFSFKVVTSKTLPAISYLTSLDKYQIINIVYLTTCCVWHSVCASLDIDSDSKFYLDKIILCFFALFFALIQLGFIISFFKSYKNIENLKKLEEKFLATL